nr:MAG TPA: hypothetical protein [Caudoviricetes sp.]
MVLIGLIELSIEFNSKENSEDYVCYAVLLTNTKGRL